MLLIHDGCLVDVNYQKVVPLGKHFDTSNVTGMGGVFHWCTYDVINIDDN